MEHRSACPGLDETFGLRPEDPSEDLVSRDVWKRHCVAEGHQTPGDLDVTEADATRDDLEQRVPVRNFGFRDVDLDEGLAICGDRHRAQSLRPPRVRARRAMVRNDERRPRATTCCLVLSAAGSPRCARSSSSKKDGSTMR